jgi:hypothetical protein
MESENKTKKSEKSHKDVFIQIRCTKDEKDKIQQLAKKQNVSVTVLILSLLKTD